MIGWICQANCRSSTISISRRSFFGMWRTPNTCSHACEFLGDCQETRDTKIHHFYEISDNFGYSAFLTSLMNSPDVPDWTLISTGVFLTNAFLELRTLSWSLLPIPEPGALLRGFQF